MRVRQAFNYALDKERLIETFSGGNALVANGPLPPGMPGYGGLEGESYPYDVEKARALLAEAGYEDPADMGTLTFTTQGYGDVGPYITAVITLWQEALGVTIEPVLLDPFTYYDELYAGNIGPLLFLRAGAPTTPIRKIFSRSSTTAIRNRICLVSAMPTSTSCSTRRAIEQDVARRLAMYQEAERRIVDSRRRLSLPTTELSAVLVSPDLEGYRLTSHRHPPMASRHQEAQAPKT